MTTQNKDVPALRFPEFEGKWNEKKLGETATSIKAGKTKPESEGAYPVYGSTGKFGFCQNYTHDGTFILIARVGANAGLLNLVSDKFGVTDNTLIFESDNKNAIGFVYYLLLKFNLNKLIFGSGQPLITGGQLQSLKISLPTLPEQQKIAAFLKTIDEKIQQLTKKKDLLEQYKKGVMQKIFNQEIRFKDDNGNDFADWEEKLLGEASEINPKNKALPESFIYIDLESVENGALQKESLVHLKDAPSRAQRLLEKNDILFQTVRPYQRNNLYFDKDGIYVASTGYAQIRTKNNSKYLYQFLHSDDFVNEVILRCTGTSYPAINSTDLSNIQINLPTLPEQERIADFLSALDIKINLVKIQLEQTQQYKKGLLQKMFV